LSEQKPLLVVIAGPMGSGKTTFYDTHLKEAFPTFIPRFRTSAKQPSASSARFAVEDRVVDTELLESARDAGCATKVVSISTEDPNLNVGRILIRMSRGRSANARLGLCHGRSLRPNLSDQPCSFGSRKDTINQQFP
jgi:hypothetical protein